MRPALGGVELSFVEAPTGGKTIHARLHRAYMFSEILSDRHNRLAA
jgi:hypothetical protein